jgi:DNA-3-methyladenine glycosylase I
VPVHDGRALFEKLSLEAFQSGLSWLTILRKRDGFRRAFADFEPERIAQWGDTEVTRLLGDAGIVRHRGKIEATLANARAWCAIEAHEGFATFLWDRVGGAPRSSGWTRIEQLPSETAESRRIARDLRGEGFRFVGPTTVYAFMQAAGLVNDHLLSCPRHTEIEAMNRGSRSP